jgi:hypothetical protein
MSDTLDRLKALNSKLEAKLSQKKSGGTPQRQQRLIDLEEEAVPPKKTAKKPSGKQTSRKRAILRGEEGHTTESAMPAPRDDQEAAEIRRLSQILIHYLRVDPAVEPVRAENLERLAELYLKLDIEKKAPNIHELFIYKAMNISGIGLKEEDFGEIREGKYVQVIAITYEPDANGKKKAKNVSLGYFGKAEALDPVRKNQVIEFVLRWRYEKAFQNLEHYRHLLERIRPKESLF